MQSYLKTKVMRRVYAIWMLRKVTSPRVAKFLILVASVWQFKEYVFVSKVLANMPSPADLKATYSFFFSAVLHTQFMVQASILIGVIFALLLLRDFTNTNRREATYWF